MEIEVDKVVDESRRERGVQRGGECRWRQRGGVSRREYIEKYVERDLEGEVERIGGERVRE